jgi:uncharacterized UBP type Zn finger protein
MYQADYEQFASTARFWTECYAMPKADGEADAAVRNLMDMGFDESAARAALDKHGGDENAAVNELLSSM